MDNLTRELIAKEKEWTEYADKAAAYLKKAPEGNVKVKPCHKKYYQYFIAVQKKGPEQPLSYQYAGPEKMPLVSKLIQKNYYQSILNYLDPALRKLQSFINWYDPNKLSTLYDRLPEARKKHIHPLVLPDNEYVQEWLQSLDPQQNSYPVITDILTNKGESVRSKSEKIIADKLSAMGIPYVYEAPCVLNGFGTIYPDFTVLNVRLRKTFYFEHFGLMESPDYVLKVIKKLTAYAQNDFWFGDGLLYTFESENSLLSTSMLDDMIRKYLL